MIAPTPADDELWSTDRLDAARTYTIDAAGVRTRVYEFGEGEPLLLIHGGQFGSLCSLDCWSLNFDLLARTFRVVAFDKIGQGYTDNPIELGDYVAERTTAHALAVVDSLGLRDIHVVGHSRGGMVAAQLALEHTALVRSLVLVDSGSVAPFDPAVPVGAFYAPFEAELDLGPERDAVLREPEAQAVHSDWITSDFVDRMYRIALQEKTRDARRCLKAVEHKVWRPSLARRREATLRAVDENGFPVPTLVMWGYEDRAAPRHLGLRLFERIAAHTELASFLLVNGAGHYLFRDRPVLFARAVADFCQPRP